MSEIDLARATELARERVHQFATAAGDEFVLLPGAEKQVEGGWVFFYNSADYIRTSDPLARLAGNGPIFVSRTGELYVFGSGSSWEAQLEELKGTLSGGSTPAC